jgi:hypothetical protein
MIDRIHGYQLPIGDSVQKADSEAYGETFMVRFYLLAFLLSQLGIFQVQKVRQSCSSSSL